MKLEDYLKDESFNNISVDFTGAKFTLGRFIEDKAFVFLREFGSQFVFVVGGEDKPVYTYCIGDWVYFTRIHSHGILYRIELDELIEKLDASGKVILSTRRDEDEI